MHKDQESKTERLNELNARLRREEEMLRDRFIYLAMDLAPARGMYAYLEERTSIPASRWKNVILKKQMPTLAMLISIIEYRPSYAHWLLLGVKANTDLQPLLDEAPTEKAWEEFLSRQKWTEDKRSGNKTD